MMTGSSKILNFLLSLIIIPMAVLISFLFLEAVSQLLKLDATERINHLAAISISCGVIIALLTYALNKSTQQTQDIRFQDQTYLSLARESFDEVFTLLEDRNNDSEVWVRAARLLLRATSLREKISTNEIREAYFLAEQKLRSGLYRILSFNPDGAAERQPLPPQFFYGIEDWETEASLEEAAQKSSIEIKVQRSDLNKNYDFSGPRELSHKSVIAIYDFLHFRQDYIDPLQNVEDWESRWEDASGHDMGARRYINHRSTGRSIDGVWHPYNKKDIE